MARVGLALVVNGLLLLAACGSGGGKADVVGGETVYEEELRARDMGPEAGVDMLPAETLQGKDWVEVDGGVLCGAEWACPEGLLCDKVKLLCVECLLPEDCGDGGAAARCLDGVCCTTHCTNRDCGEDGCGGSCGECSGATPDCMMGVCSCKPDCEEEEKVCGSDGCGGSCGDCKVGEMCSYGTCAPVCPVGGKRCKGLTAVEECRQAEDGSLSWVLAETCVGGFCKENVCVGACELNVKDYSYLGCDYWAVDLDNYEKGETLPVGLVVSAPPDGQDATVRVTDMLLVPPMDLPPAALKVDDMLVKAGQLKVFLLPGDHNVTGSNISRKTFRVRTDTPVTVHQFNPLHSEVEGGDGVFTNDASLLLPARTGGREYIVLSWPRDYFANTAGFATVVATQEGTTRVEIRPSCKTTSGANVAAMAPREEPYVFELEYGQVLNFETDESSGGVFQDLSGTLITSDKEISVFGGHECAYVPLNPSFCCCDHLEQQLLPLHAWGRNYVADAFSPRNEAAKDTWRIVAGADGVNVTLIPAAATLLGDSSKGKALEDKLNNMSKGKVVEFEAKLSFTVSADGPVLVGHYMQGSHYPGYNPLFDLGDPAFTLAPPVEQYLDSYVFLIPPDYNFDYVNIVRKAGAALLLDGSPLEQPFTAVGEGSDWELAQVSIADGVHVLASEAAFGITVYGIDDDVSYAYPGGMRVKALAAE